GLRAEDELAPLAEEDPGPGAAAALDQHAHQLAQDVVGIPAAVQDPVDGFECSRAHGSNAVTSSRKDSGTGRGRRLLPSMRTIVCFAVAISRSAPPPSSSRR